MSDFIEDRKFVARLLLKVRLGELSVCQAMMNYPKDVKDETLIAAYHALIHYEADEDIRAKDELFKEEQDDYLEFISNTLAKGEDLPQNIIDNYKEFYSNAPVLHKKNGFFTGFWKYLNIKEKDK